MPVVGLDNQIGPFQKLYRTASQMSFPYSLCCKVPFPWSCQSKGLLVYRQWAALLGSCTEVIARLMAQPYESINCFKVNFYVKLQILLNHVDTFKMSLFSLQQNMMVPLWKVKRKQKWTTASCLGSEGCLHAPPWLGTGRPCDSQWTFSVAFVKAWSSIFLPDRGYLPGK